MFRRTAAILAAAIAFAACAPAPAPSTAPQTGGAQQPAQTEKRSANQAIKFAQIGLPASMSPEASASNIPLYSLMFDNLVWVDLDGKVTPETAEKWELTSPTTWRLTIRKGATFSNGDPVTVDDIEFSLNTMLELKFPQITQFIGLTKATKVNDTTLDLTTAVPDASVIPGLIFAWIMPKKYFSEVGKTGFSAKPIGSGPYELVEFRNNDIAVFKRRSAEHPWKKAQATDITIRSIVEQTQMAAGLRTGDLDLVYGSLAPDVVDGIAKTDAKVYSRPLSNISALISQPEMKLRDTPLQDKRVRLAMNYAVDKEGLAKTLFRGYAIATGQMTIPSSPAWDPNIKPVPYDPAMAKKLLAEAGYPNGFKMPVGIEFTPQTVNPGIATLLQSNLRDVGIEAPVTAMELAAFLDKYYGRNGQVKGDLFIQATGDANGFMSQAQGLYSCKLALVWWCSSEFDSNMAAANAEPDLTKRSALMRKAIAGFSNDVAHINLLVSATFGIHGPKIRGFNFDASTNYKFWEVYRVD